MNIASPASLSFHCSGETLLASHVIRYRPLGMLSKLCIITPSHTFVHIAMLQANGIVMYTPAHGEGNSARSRSPNPGPSSSSNSKKRKASAQLDVKPILVLSDDEDDDVMEKEARLKVLRSLAFFDHAAKVLNHYVRNNLRNSRTRKRDANMQNNHRSE